jgi:hypothetical protein
MVRENGQKYWKNSDGTETAFEPENPRHRPKEITRQEYEAGIMDSTHSCDK